MVGWFRIYIPRSPGTHVVGSWDIDSKNVYRDFRTGTQYVGNWASRVCLGSAAPETPKFEGFPKLGLQFLGVPIIRIIVFGGLYWGPPILGNYHLHACKPW